MSPLNKSLLVDRYGAAIYSTQRYSSQTNKVNNINWMSNRYFNNTRTDNYKFLSPSERLLINSFALDLFRSSPAIHSAIVRKNEWSCATQWKPLYKGKDDKWGATALEYLNQVAYPNCSIAGNNVTFNRLLLSIANQLDIAGDVLIVLTVTRDGLSRLALYPSNLVGQRVYGKQTVETGRYRGATIDDGVILNSTGTPIAFHVLQSSKEDDFDISARDAHLLYEPTELTNRGISVVAPSLLSFLNLEDIATYITKTVKNESKQGLVVSTESGTGDEYARNPLTYNDTSVNNSTSVPQVVEMGDVTFVRTGEKVESLKTDRPHNNSQQWIRSIEEKCIHDLGWSLALISPEKLTGANASMIESQVQQTIEVRQSTLKRIASVFTQYALARAMETGELPKINTPDWRAWDWSMPSEFFIKSPDVLDLQGWNAGSKTLQEISARNGSNWKETRQQRQNELSDAIARAKALVIESDGNLSFIRALDLIGVGTSNVSPLAEQVVRSEVTE
jgi:hypothetical protein